MTFKIGGPARWFAEAASEDDVVEATAWARSAVWGSVCARRGSNLLVADAGFDGLVLRIGLRRGFKSEGSVTIRIANLSRRAAGEDWDDFVERAVLDGCAGIECLAGIPGTVVVLPCRTLAHTGRRSLR